MSNKREHARVKVERNLQIILSNGILVNALMTNISNGGVGILYPISSDIGTQFKVCFSLPKDDSKVQITELVTVVHVFFFGIITKLDYSLII